MVSTRSTLHAAVTSSIYYIYSNHSQRITLDSKKFFIIINFIIIITIITIIIV